MEYLSKQAWGDATSFSQFNSIILGTMRDTKKIYDSTYYNAFFGTNESTKKTQSLDIDLAAETTGLTGLEKARMEATVIAREIADMIDNLTDVSRDYNDYGFLRSYDEKDIKIVWNKKWLNKIRKVDLPTIFHKDGLIDKFGGDTLHSRFFGKVITTAGTAAGTERSLIETSIEVAEGEDPRAKVNKKDGKYYVHLFPGDLLVAGKAYGANEAYTPDENIICKIVVKLPVLLSGFEVGTSFYNARNLSTNHYLTFGVNILEAFSNYPFITVHVSE